MPFIDLISPAHGLDPLAPFKVLAVMCHPGDHKMRERMLASIQRGTRHGVPRRAALEEERFLQEVGLRSKRAILAGGLLLTLIQLQENGLSSSLNRAIALMRPLLESWEQPIGPEWSSTVHADHTPTSRRKILRAFNEYLVVAHLWAAHFHAYHSGRTDIWPGSNQTLPRFMAHAEYFADKGANLRWAGQDRRMTLLRRAIWRFGLPERLRETCDLVALPLTPEQRSIFDDYRPD